MEDKNVTKINLSTFFIIFGAIGLVIIIFIITLIVFLSNNQSSTPSPSSTQAIDTNSTTDLSVDSTDNISTTLSKSEALLVLKEKFKIAEKLWLNSSDFFNLKIDEQITDLDKTILEYGTENFLKEVKRNLPLGIVIHNNKYYITTYVGNRNYIEFDGFENINITSTSITATLKTKQTSFDGNKWISVEDKKSEFKLVKKDDEWLIDKFNSTDLD